MHCFNHCPSTEYHYRLRQDNGHQFWRNCWIWSFPCAAAEDGWIFHQNGATDWFSYEPTIKGCCIGRFSEKCFNYTTMNLFSKNNGNLSRKLQHYLIKYCILVVMKLLMKQLYNIIKKNRNYFYFLKNSVVWHHCKFHTGMLVLSFLWSAFYRNFIFNNEHVSHIIVITLISYCVFIHIVT